MSLAQRLLRIECRDLIQPRPYGQAGVRGQTPEGLFAALRCAGDVWHELHVVYRTTPFKSLSSSFWKFLWFGWWGSNPRAPTNLSTVYKTEGIHPIGMLLATIAQSVKIQKSVRPRIR